MPFNRFTTIHWEAAGVADPLRATGRYLKLLGDAARASGSPFAYVWVRENGPGKGEHVHILWHGAIDLPVFKRRVRGWLKRCGGRPEKGVCKTVTVSRSLSDALISHAAYRANLGTVMDYHLKGADAEARAVLKVQRAEPGGQIVGKRCGTSINIGRKARGRT